MARAGIFSLLLILLTLTPLRVFALPLDGTVAINDTTEEFPLNELGLSENTVLLGPYDEVMLRFSLPYHWDLQPGAALVLELGSYFSSLIPNENATLPTDTIIGELSVWLNGSRAGSIQLNESGNSSHTLKIDEKHLNSGEKTSLNELVMRWDALAACQFGIGSSVTLLPGSKLFLPHQLASVAPDLTIFPAPFHAEKSLFQAIVRLVVPDQPSPEELQAAVAIAAGLGSLSRGVLPVNLIRSSEVTDLMKYGDHLFFIGTIDQLSQFNDPLFTSTVLSELSTVDASPGEGVLLELVSPWQPARMVVVVSGEDGSAVSQAGLALSSGKFITTAQNNLARISGLSLPSTPAEIAIETTFAELDQPTRKITEFGMHELIIPFKIAAGKMLSPEAYLDLYINHSKTIDYFLSGLWVKLNGIPIGSVRFSDQSSETNLTRFIIPPSAIQVLSNEIEIQINMVSSNACPLPGLDDHWITIFSDSVLHLPEVEPPGKLIAPLMIGDFPLPFIYLEGLQDVTFIVQEDMPETWAAAASLAFDLGHQSGSDFYQAEVFYSNALEVGTLKDKQLIVIGASSLIPFETELNDVLPAPFASDGTLQDNIATSINYAGIEGKSTGFIELVNFSTYPMREALFVLGNDEAGVSLAVGALLDEVVRGGLAASNFAIVQAGKVVSDNIRIQPVLDATAEPSSAIKQDASSLRLWMIIGLGITILAVVGLVISSMVSANRRKRVEKIAVELKRALAEKKKGK